MPGYRYYTDFFLLTLLKVRFEGKRDSIWKLKISNWKDFQKKQHCVQKSVSKQMHINFSELKFHEIALRRSYYLTFSNFAKMH